MKTPLSLKAGNSFIIKFLIISGILFFSFLPFYKASAQGNLMIMPKRMVFEGPKRSGELSLANTGKDTTRYEISLIHYRMKEDGSMEELKKEDSSILFADKNVRFFPRSVVLAPNEAQTVRIQLMQSSKLSEGEYRSHLYFRAVPNPKPLGETQLNKDTSGIRFNMKPVFGISIPVIIRIGESTAKVDISKTSFVMADGKTAFVKLQLNRSGNMSVYGDLTVDHISPEGKVIRVATQKGMAVYTPNDVRYVKISLDTTAGINYSTGRLHVVYQAQENVNQNNIAQTEVFLH